jgi:hypothetical protein
LTAGPPATGRPGSHASVITVITDPEGATVRFENLTISTSFGSYNFSSGRPFSLASDGRNYNTTLDLPVDLRLGNYNLTINVSSWQYLDAQAQEWISLHWVRLNETLVVTNNPSPPSNPPNNPGPSPPSSGQGPSTSTNKTTTSSLTSLLVAFRSLIMPVAAGYVALGFLALVLLIRQERKRSAGGQILSPSFCQSCGTGLIPGVSICPSCGRPTVPTTDWDKQPLNHSSTAPGT